MRRSLLLFAAFSATAAFEVRASGRPDPLPQVLTATYFDISPPLRDMIAAADPETPQAPPLLGPEPRGTLEWSGSDAAVHSGNTTLAIPAPALSFNSIDGTGFGIAPPTPSADVGLNHYVVMCNLRYAIYDKNGVLVSGPFNNNTIWAGFGGDCQTQNSGNPQVLYDQLAQRWVLTQPTYTGATYGLCIAVSTGPDPLGSYYRWSYSFGTRFPDYPRLALWPDAYYLGTREFDTVSGPLLGSGAYAFNRSDLINGVASPRVVGFQTPSGAQPYLVGDGLLPADLDGQRQPAAGSPAFFLGSMDSGGPYGAPQDALTLWRFHADFVTPANSTFTQAATLPVNNFVSIYACPGGGRRCIPQPGAVTAQYLDFSSNRQRLLNRVVYRNLGGHDAIVAAQSVEVGGPIAGTRWYELRDPGGSPVVYQQGTYAPGVADGTHRWCGSIAMDNAGNMALGYSVSSTSVFPGIRYTGRLDGDALDQMTQGEATFATGGGFQSSTSNRWGDHSSMNLDPADDCTFWYLNEYYPVTASVGWVLHVGTFKFPSCLAPVGIDVDRPQPTNTRLAPIGAVRGPVEIAFTLGGADPRRVQLDVFDVSGRRVRRLVDESLGGGRYHVSWDRTRDGGERLRPGVYHLRLRAGDEHDSEGVVLLQ